eukprot:m.131251 g.131251  ORF g.131251 m.131251 type:complete len:440 (-) comp29532_c0_seq1:61-1380(-)
MGDTVFILVGQCGITIGNAFFEEVTRRCGQRAPFHAPSTGPPRCVLIDTENKVVRKVLSKKTAALYGCEAVVSNAGRGGNFAYGFLGSEKEKSTTTPSTRWVTSSSTTTNDDNKEKSILSRALETIRKLAEMATIQSFIIVHSLAGGSGSGLGTRIICELRQIYRTHFIASVAITPFRSGENPLQNYNMVLSGAKLQENADMVILFQNDQVKKLAAPMGNASQWSMQDTNDIIASSMAGVLLPVIGAQQQNARARFGNLWELCTTVCPSPDWKFVHASSFPYGLKQKGASSGFAGRTASSVALAELLLGTLPRYDVNKAKISTISAQLILRGFKSDQRTELPALLKTAKRMLSPASWNPFPLDIRYDATEFITAPATSAALLANRSDVVDPLKEALHKTVLMYDAKAYWHWYTRCGMEDDDMITAMETVQSVITAYSDI